MKLTSLIWLAAAMAVVAAGLACGGSSGPSAERERAGVRITLSADRESYKPGDTIKLKAEAENLRDADLTYGFVTAEEPGLQIRVNTDLGGRQLVNADDEPIGGSGTQTLAPGGKVSASGEWDQMLALYTTPVQAPEGEYAITASLAVSTEEGSEESVELTAAVTIRLEGGEPLLPVEEAIRIAIEDSGLKAWLARRQATGAHCLYQPSSTYLFANVQAGAVNEVDPDLYDLALQNQRPVCSPVSVGDEWRVQFFSGSGPEPARVAVYMDIHTGENPRFEEGGLGPEPSPAE
jgi:hypothetical protein